MTLARINRGSGNVTGVTSIRHGLHDGDVITFGSRWQRLGMLLTKPRKSVVFYAARDTFLTRDARMTWRDWRRALWNAVR